jgi:hypothetical protein
MHMKPALVVLSLAALGSIAAAVACSSSSSTTGGGADAGSAGQTVTVHVSAASGGTVSDATNTATLAIPGGALAQDTDITLAVGATTSDTVASVYDFGPDGLQFQKPAALTIKTDQTAPQGKALSIAYQDSTGAWKPVDGSSVANGAVTANISHFTKYSIVIVDGQVVLQPPSGCTDVVANFKPCGGDVTGTWVIKDFCVGAQSIASDPFDGGCPGFTASVDVQNTQTITFNAGTETSTAGTETDTFTYDFPASCFADGGSTPTCAQIGNNGTTCVDKGGGICECTKTQTKQHAAETKTYTTSGSVFTDYTNGVANGPVDYCVSNSDLWARPEQNNDAGLIYVLQKQ